MSDAYNAMFGTAPANPNPPQGQGQAYAAALGQPAAAPAGAEFAPVLTDVGAHYPGLAPYLGNVVVQRGKPSGPQDDRQLEYYAPWESDNPNPGRSTVELYSPDLKGDSLREAVALDMLHHVGGIDPKGQPVNPAYFALKQQMMSEITAAKRPMDAEAYAEDKKAYPETGSYQDWLQGNRADAYIRAYVNPAMNPEWNRPGMFTPGMKAAGDKIVQYLRAKPK